MDNIEEIKNRLDIVEIIREYVKLQPAGKNWKALCPFHKEKTPSFMVSPERQIWHCFGCGRGGDIFTFLMEAERIEFKEALKILAKRAGVELRKVSSSQNTLKNKLLDINELAKRFFSYLLEKSPQAQIAREYLKKRQVSSEIRKEFSLGYAPASWDSLLKFLKSKGFGEKEIEEAGLAVKKENSSSYYDRFRHRLMFPIANLHGQTVGFSGRALGEEGAKYINSPQTLVYNKSQVLYGLDKAKTQALKEDFMIIVEGQMDLLSAHQAGTTNTVATSGTALTEGHLKILKRYTPNLLFAFDSDKAGEMAIKRGMDIALSLGLNVKIIKLPPGKDPDELIKEDVKNWQLAIKNAQPLLNYFFDQAFSRYNPETLEGKKKIIYDLLPIIARVADPIEKDYFLKMLSQKTGADEGVLRQGIEKEKRRAYNKEATNNKEAIGLPNSPHQKIAKTAEETLALFLVFPESVSHLIRPVSPFIFAKKKMIRAFEEIKNFYEANNAFAVEEFLKQFKGEEDFYFFLERLVLLGEKDYLDLSKEQAERQIKTNLAELEKHFIKERKKYLQNKLVSLEKEGRQEETDKILEEIAELDKKIIELENWQ